MNKEKFTTCVVIGHPISHSLSPLMHNAGYKALGIADRFRFEAMDVLPRHLGDAIKNLRQQNIRGISVTAPHKLEIIKYLDALDPIAKKIKATNTIVNENGKLTGYNTDWVGITLPLEKLTPLSGKRVALLGAGGAARAIAYAVTSKGAKLIIYNRTLGHAERLAKEFGGRAMSLSKVDSISKSHIIINSLPPGAELDLLSRLLENNTVHAGHIVFDINYNPVKTKLLAIAQTKNAVTIPGTEMLLYQGMEQFKLYTGQTAPEHVMRSAIKKSVIS